MENIRFRNGVTIPQVGLGVFRAASGAETENAVKWALAAGYRHIDTAAAYNNEESVGKAVRESGVPRDQIFITTKLWNADTRAGRTKEALKESLKKLGTDYVDLYLIHWPAEGYEKAWLDIVDLYEEGLIRVPGVSNFHAHHLLDLAKLGRTMPMADQIESNPYFSNQEVIDYCFSNDIQVEAWSPLGGSRDGNVLADPVFTRIGAKYGKTAAQLIIRWHMQRGLIVLPKSVHRERIESNFEVCDFTIDREDMALLNSLNKNKRVGADPENFNF